MTNTAEQVVGALRSHRRWVVTAHGRPDGDAVGSVLAAVELLRAMELEADGFLADGVPPIYRALPGAASLGLGPVDNARYDGALILECDSLERTHLAGLDGLFLINLDHHNTAREYADINYIVPNAAAVAELVARVASAACISLTPEMATCLYAAELTDTGAFRYAGTNAATFGFARAMVAAGADPVAIARQVYFSNPLAKMALLGRALSHLHCEDGLAWMHVSLQDMRDCQATPADCEGLVNWALSIAGVEAAVFLRESDGSEGERYRVSLRSKGGIDVARIAQQFGGGGHSCASGIGLDGSLEAVSRRVLDVLREALRLVES